MASRSIGLNVERKLGVTSPDSSLPEDVRHGARSMKPRLHTLDAFLAPVHGIELSKYPAKLSLRLVCETCQRLTLLNDVYELIHDDQEDSQDSQRVCDVCQCNVAVGNAFISDKDDFCTDISAHVIMLGVLLSF